MTPRTIAVGVDGSGDARRAFEWAATLARALDASLVVVHAVGLLEHGAHDSHAWFDVLDAPGTRVRKVLRDGNPADTLRAVGEEEEADLLVVGSRGIGGTPSRLLGSTSTQLLQESTVPVVVIPHPAPSHRDGSEDRVDGR
jgi:nucleotide-binding universal stress UspA family protein